MTTSLPAEGGSLSPRATKPDYKIVQREYESACWEWQKTLNHSGYGTGSFTALGITTNYAHRAYYMVANGPIPPGMSGGVLDHLCRNPRCVNPAHLEFVPPHINVHRGEQAVITMDDARAIRARIKAGELMTPIAEEYGLSIHTVHWIAEDIMWREDYSAPREPIRPEGVTCPECGVAITHGKRNKKFCCGLHRTRFNQRRAWRLSRGLDPDGGQRRATSPSPPRQRLSTNEGEDR